MSRAYVPETKSEIVDLLSSMLLGAPQFRDGTGYFPDRSIDTEFRSLEEGLSFLRRKLGEERYVALVAMSVQARALCEADPHDTNGKAREGRAIFLRMQELIGDRRPTKE